MEIDPRVQLELVRLFNLYDAAPLPRTADEAVDPATGIRYRDVIIDADTAVSARLYLPKSSGNMNKLPILIYIHGGGFFMGSPYSPIYHNYLLSLVSSAGVVAVSVEYRLAPRHLLPAAYDDAHTALTWVLSRADPWLAEHGDYNRIFIAGDSAGANITSNLTLREGVNVEGMVLVHPYFWGSTPIESEISHPLLRWGFDLAWRLVKSPDMTLDHPSVNPLAEGSPSLAGLGCRRAMVVTAEMDVWVFRGRAYCGALKESGFAGEATAFEGTGPEAVHVYHLSNPGTEMAAELMDKIVAFINPV